VVGALLTVGLIAIGSSFESPASDSTELGAKKRTSASLEAKKP
jgi:hypothetical protein